MGSHGPRFQGWAWIVAGASCIQGRVVCRRWSASRIKIQASIVFQMLWCARLASKSLGLGVWFSTVSDDTATCCDEAQLRISTPYYIDLISINITTLWHDSWATQPTPVIPDKLPRRIRKVMLQNIGYFLLLWIIEAWRHSSYINQGIWALMVDDHHWPAAKPQSSTARGVAQRRLIYLE